MIIETLSTFPSMYDSVMGSSMMRIAQEKGILSFVAYDLRDWTHDRHRTTDDDPYGGGAGLVMKCEPIFEAFEALVGDAAGGDADAVLCLDASSPAAVEPASCVLPEGVPDSQGERGGPLPQHAGKGAPHTIFLSPTGEPFNDALACELAQEERLLFICGHYEGIDERAYALADRTISLGDYVLTSGELASMVIIDAVVRKVPGVLGAETGALDESFSDGLLEYPQYTRPASFRGAEVPAILLSGNHAAIARWRREASLERTARLRPDLLEDVDLSPTDREFLRTLETKTSA